jgi:ATP-dependent exoDNAse (exonuclease V) alpha subunit
MRVETDAAARTHANRWCVIIGKHPLPLATQLYLLLQRNLVYTGITQGKKLVVLVGQRKALAIAVRNNKTQSRFSGLLSRLSAVA